MASNAEAKQSYVDVLIIGAGPAGLMACNALAKAGVNVRIVDQRPAKVAAGQADGIQPRTIEIFQSYGLADRLLKDGNQMHMAAFYNPSQDGGIELTDRVPDVTAPSARYPFEITLHQGAIETIFLDSLRSSGIAVERPVVPVAIQLTEDKTEMNDPTSYPIKVSLRNLASTQSLEWLSEVVHAKFLIGADGAHSWVRKTFNIAMEGEQSDSVWGVIDMVPESDFPDIRNKTVVHSNHGSLMIIPREDDKIRVYIQLDDSNTAGVSNGRIDKSQTRPEQFLEVAQRILQPHTLDRKGAFDWWTVYIIGQRVASRFSVQERVFIVGDACHTHSPKAGQGMNASMSDSHNLAWKITHVLRDWAPLSLVKSYEFERRQYAQDLISFDRRFAKFFSGKPRTEENQDGISHEDFLKIFQTFGGFTSGIGIHYLPSSITDTHYQSYAANVVIGQRIPPQVFIRAADSRPVEIQDLLPANSRFKLLVFTGDISNPDQMTQVHGLAQALKDTLLPFAYKNDVPAVFDILAIALTKRTHVGYHELPILLRPHWSQVLVDKSDVKGQQGGDGYRNYGVDPSGAIIVVRPDGHVGSVVPFHKVDHLSGYFNGFMNMRNC